MNVVRVSCRHLSISPISFVRHRCNLRLSYRRTVVRGIGFDTNMTAREHCCMYTEQYTLLACFFTFLYFTVYFKNFTAQL